MSGRMGGIYDIIARHCFMTPQMTTITYHCNGDNYITLQFKSGLQHSQLLQDLSFRIYSPLAKRSIQDFNSYSRLVTSYSREFIH